MNITDKNLEKYIKAFETHFNGEKQQAFHQIRKEAIVKANDLGFPTTKQEEWRFTNPAEIVKSDFKLANKNNVNNVTGDDIKAFLFEGWSGSVVVLIDGFYSEKLSLVKHKKGLLISALSDYLNKNDDAISLLSKITSFDKDIFTALNTAFVLDGCVIQISDNTILDDSIHIMHVSSEKDIVSNDRNMILVGKNAQVTVVESFHSLKNEKAFINTVTEILIDENAHLNHYKLQDESVNHLHVGNNGILQKANSHFASMSFDFGGKLIRNNISTTLDGEGITSILNGLYIGTGNQHVDNHTFIDHAKPYCESHELYRGILDGKSSGVFSGKIMVRKDAQKTDAKQSNNCLLLSDYAQINAKPQLEIYADDVKCTHGATVGQLDEEAIGYLRSRGIPKKKAIQMLTYAFAEEIIINITDETFRKKVESRLLESLSK